jgi:hypothetical protein
MTRGAILSNFCKFKEVVVVDIKIAMMGRGRCRVVLEFDCPFPINRA